MWRVLYAQKPAIFVLENVKNLKSHDKGKTFKVIMDTLDELGYEVADAAEMGKTILKLSTESTFTSAPRTYRFGRFPS